MHALIDQDMILYQAAFSAQFKDDEGEELILPFESAKESMDKLIADILDAVGADSHTLFITGKGNFREAIAKKEVYKDSRKEKEKPFHYENLKAYSRVCLGAVVVEGMEADDAMVIEQCAYKGRFGEEETIICSRDKDLRMCPGWHYSWECHNQPERTPHFVEPLGEYDPKYKQVVSKKTGVESTVFNKLEATGLRLFYAQILMGDRVDTIPGLPGVGAKGAYDALVGCVSEMEMYLVCLGMYADKYVDEAYEAFSEHAAESGIDRDHTDLEYEEVRDEFVSGYIDRELLEQARLVWMVRELHEDGSPVMWEAPIA